jgi:hypothetical protein
MKMNLEEATAAGATWRLWIVDGDGTTQARVEECDGQFFAFVIDPEDPTILRHIDTYPSFEDAKAQCEASLSLRAPEKASP